MLFHNEPVCCYFVLEIFDSFILPLQEQKEFDVHMKIVKGTLNCIGLNKLMEELVINQALREHIAWEVYFYPICQAEHTITFNSYSSYKVKFPPGRNGSEKEP